jgi:hypothetical protein
MCVPFRVCAISDDDHPADVHIEAAAQRPVALMSTCTTSVQAHRTKILRQGSVHTNGFQQTGCSDLQSFQSTCICP